MDVKQSPFDEKLVNCVATIGELEKRLVEERELKNSLLTSMEQFYTNELKDLFFKEKAGKKLGKISRVFTKSGKLFVHLYFLNITTNSKLVKSYTNFELFGNDMKNLVLLSEAEYKEAFFDYVDEQIQHAGVQHPDDE